MKNLAQLNKNNVVINIILANDDFPSDGFVEYTDANPAFIGGDFIDGYFYPPQPYPSWTRLNGLWVSPKPYPIENGFWIWVEADLNWQIIGEK